MVTEELVFFNSAIKPCPCQGAPAFEEAEADALATGHRPDLLGNTQHNYTEMLTQVRGIPRSTNRRDRALKIEVNPSKGRICPSKDFIKTTQSRPALLVKILLKSQVHFQNHRHFLGMVKCVIKQHVKSKGLQSELTNRILQM